MPRPARADRRGHPAALAAAVATALLLAGCAAGGVGSSSGGSAGIGGSDCATGGGAQDCAPGDAAPAGPDGLAPTDGGVGGDAGVGSGPWLPLKVDLSVFYDLPVGTKVEWFYNLDPHAGNCLLSWAKNWLDTVGRTGELRVVSPLLVAPSLLDSASCQFERSYGTWQVRVTAPGKTPRPGSIFVRTGLPSPVSDYVETTCHDFADDFVCRGDSTSQGESKGLIAVDLTLGPFR